MEITRNTLDTSPGPADWFTGTAFFGDSASLIPLGRCEA